MKPKILTQKTKFTCGPVAVWNIMSLFNRKPIGITKLRKLLDTTHEGTNTVDIVKLLKRIGFKVKLVNRRSRNGVYFIHYYHKKGGHFVVASKHGVHNEVINGRLAKFANARYVHARTFKIYE